MPRYNGSILSLLSQDTRKPHLGESGQILLKGLSSYLWGGDKSGPYVPPSDDGEGPIGANLRGNFPRELHCLTRRKWCPLGR